MTKKHRYPKQRRSPVRRGQIVARGVRRDTPDVSKLSRALMQIALEQAAAEAAAEAEGKARREATQ